MAALKSPDALKTIGEVAEDLDLATHVLRFWEGKFSQIKPQKRRGRRYYRPQDVDTIKQIKTLLYEQGYTIKGVKKYLASGGAVTEAAEAVSSKKQASEKEALANDNSSVLAKEDINQLKAIYEGLQKTKAKLGNVA